MAERDIVFLCRISDMDEGELKVKLPFPFFHKYGCRLPTKVRMEFPSGEVWYGKYTEGSHYINGLEEMKSFYGIMPYYMFLLRYCGNGHFKINVFNQCAVEICYPLYSVTGSEVLPGQKVPFVGVMSNKQITEIEIQKLGASFAYNAITNCLLCHDIIIQREHLIMNSEYGVMRYTDLKKLGLETGKEEIEIFFERDRWTIKLMTKEGIVFFNEGWFKFLKEANICEGDVCVIVRTAYNSIFKIAVLPKAVFLQWSETADNPIAMERFSWYKILRGRCLVTGTVGMPRLFGMRFGRELGRNIWLITSDGRVFRAQYTFAENKITGLLSFMSAYHLYNNCILVLEYVGHSEFMVSIFDSRNVDHLNKVNGKFVSDILREIKMSEPEDGNGKEEQNEDRLKSKQHDDEVVSIGEGVEYCRGAGNETGNIDLRHIVKWNPRREKGEGKVLFLVKLQKSHFQKKGRGVYCSPVCYEIYRQWTCGTKINLQCEGQKYEVGVQRNNRSCRFGRGWDEFIRKTKFRVGQLLEFTYINRKTFEVTRKI